MIAKVSQLLKSLLGGRSKWVLAALLAFVVPAFAIETLIYDAEKGKWLKYDQRTAIKFYRKHGQAPGDFQRKIVKFRTAEEPGTIIIDGKQNMITLLLSRKNNCTLLGLATAVAER